MSSFSPLDLFLVRSLGLISTPRFVCFSTSSTDSPILGPVSPTSSKAVSSTSSPPRLPTPVFLLHYRSYTGFQANSHPSESDQQDSSFPNLVRSARIARGRVDVVDARGGSLDRSRLSWRSLDDLFLQRISTLNEMRVLHHCRVPEETGLLEHGCLLKGEFSSSSSSLLHRRRTLAHVIFRFLYISAQRFGTAAKVRSLSLGVRCWLLTVFPFPSPHVNSSRRSKARLETSQTDLHESELVFLAFTAFSRETWVAGIRYRYVSTPRVSRSFLFSFFSPASHVSDSITSPSSRRLRDSHSGVEISPRLRTRKRSRGEKELTLSS